MKKLVILYSIIITLLFWRGNDALAQTNEELFQNYPEEIGVMTQNFNYINIYFEAGQLKAKYEVINEQLIIDDKKIAAFATESVYHNFFRQLESLEAATLIPSSKSFKKVPTNNIKLRSSFSESVFFDDSKHSEISFNNLERGNRTYLKYTIQLQNVYMLPFIFIQESIPTEHFKLVVSLPKGLTIDDILHPNTSNINLTKTVSEQKNKTIITWEAKKIPGLKYQPYVPSMFYTATHLVLRLGKYTDNKNNTTNYLHSSKDLSQYLNTFVKDINKENSPAIQSKVVELCKSAKSEREKAKNIYNWVQQNIRYIAYEDSLGGFIPREANLVFKRKFGDCKDMSSLLKVMCNMAGLDARYTWIGTSKLPYKIKETPIPSAFNHMICAVKIDNKWEFLDATDSEIPFGFTPENIQGKEAFIYADNLDFIIHSIPYEPLENTTIIDTTFMSFEQQTLTGNIKIKTSGYIAWDVITKLKYESAKNYEKLFAAITNRGSNKYQQKEFDYKFDDQGAKDLWINSKFELPDYVNEYGDQLYLNMNLTKPFESMKFDLKDRKSPIYLNDARILQHVVIFNIPKDYKVSTLPANVEKDFSTIGSVLLNYTVNNNQIIFTRTIKLKQPEISMNDVRNLTKLLETLQSNYKSTVELTKKK